MLDLVPLAGARRQMTDVNRQAGRVRESLQLPLPQTQARSVAPAAVRRDQQRPRPGVRLAAHVPPPTADGVHRQRRRVVGDAHVDPPRVASHVVHPVGNSFAEPRINEVVNRYLFGPAQGNRKPAMGDSKSAGKQNRDREGAIFVPGRWDRFLTGAALMAGAALIDGAALRADSNGRGGLNRRFFRLAGACNGYEKFYNRPSESDVRGSCPAGLERSFVLPRRARVVRGRVPIIGGFESGGSGPRKGRRQFELTRVR